MTTDGSKRGVTRIGAAWCGTLIAALVAGGAAGAARAEAQKAVAQATPAPGKAAPAAAAPQGGAGSAAAEPEVTTATYQDWLVRCVTPPSAAKLCEATQTIQVQGQAGPIAMIAVGRLAADGPLRVAVQLPAGIWLPAGAKLQAGEKAAPVALEFKRCLQGCFAEAEVDKALEQTLRTASGSGSLAFEDGARRPVTVPFSFRGFVPALDAAVKAR